MLGLQSETFNVLQLATGFSLFLVAFNAQGFIVQTVVTSGNYDISKHAGYISMAIIYGVFTFANFTAPPIVGLLGIKRALVIGVFCYATYECGFLFLNEYFLYFSSALVGFGGSILFASQGKYNAMNSTDETAGKLSSIYWAVSKACLIGGGLFLYIVFANTNDTDDISQSTVKILSCAFTAISIGAAILMAFLRMPSIDPQITEKNKVRNDRVSHKKKIFSTFKLMATKRMLLLSLTFMYSGVTLSFWSSIYLTCVSYTHGLGPNTKQYLAFCAISIGFGHVTSGVILRVLGGFTIKIGSSSIVVVGNIIHLCVFFAVYLNFPHEASLRKTDAFAIIGKPSLIISLACAFFLGFGDACWNTQIYTMLISKYKKQSAEAFSIFKFFQCLLTSTAFFIGAVLELQWYLLILVVAGILGCIGFILAERLPSDEIKISTNNISMLEKASDQMLHSELETK